jgi:hypothetical protein
MSFEVAAFDVAKFDAILARGLSSGVGERSGQMCIEAAICAVLDLPHDDDPGCVAPAVRAFKIKLNDGRWSSPAARAKGLRELGLAQLGSAGTITDEQFTDLLAERTIRVLIPRLFRTILVKHPDCLAAAERCEKEGTVYAAYAAYAAADAAYAAADAAYAAAYTADAARAVCAADAAYAAACAAYAAAYTACAADAARAADEYLLLSAQIALDVLAELKSPGCALLPNVGISV